MLHTITRHTALAVALFATAGCVVHNTEPPALTGPSTSALNLTLTATPDSISQDGGSQSSIRVTAIGPDGRPMSSLPLRMDMSVNGVAQDFGTLSARTIVTNNAGVATVVFTAPAPPPNGLFGTCNGLPGTCVSIVATATGSNFFAANTESVRIRLVPLGVILPPAGAPTPAFTVTPTPVQHNVAATFDASASTPGQGATQISAYDWTFGDGGSASGKTVTHTFAATGSFAVTLTVTNDRGVSASSVQTVSVAASPTPTVSFVVSPPTPVVGQTVFFNGDASRAAPGRSIVQWTWDFGDGTTSSSAISVSHTFSTAGTFIVVLTVRDDADQRSTTTAIVNVGTGNPEPVITPSPTTGAAGVTIAFSSAGSRTFNGATISTYLWDFGDPGSGAQNTSAAANQAHKFNTPGTFIVRLTITDSLGRTGTTTVSVTIS